MKPSFSGLKTKRAVVKKIVVRRITILIPALLVCAFTASAQTGPVQGGTEIQIWTAGGHSVSGGRGGTGIWDTGLRYGWFLTDAHGPSFLNGRFEYAIDAVPLYLIFQPSNTAYGVGLNPLNLKWDFERRGHLVPYVELGGGLLFTTHQVPPRTSSVNFTPSGGFGVHYLGARLAWTLEARYFHISNAGLSRSNPGINSFVVRIGVGKLRK